MKFIFTLAMKNLNRYKRRTAVTAIAIAIGLMMYILVDSLLLGVEIESERNLIWYETSSVRIHNKDYWPDRLLYPLKEGIEKSTQLTKLLGENGYTATERIVFKADMVLYSNDFGEDGNFPVVVTAIDPEKDYEVFHYKDTLIEGRFLNKGEEDGILLGSWLAEDIGAEIGYWVTLLTRGNGGFFEAIDVQVVGIVNCPNPNVNRTLLMMDIDSVGAVLGMDGSVTEIDIKLPERADVDNEVTKIAEILDKGGFTNLQAQSWKMLAKDYLAIAEAKRGGTGVILFLVFIIAAVGISNTMLMAMYERTRELGMMRAMGMKENHIRLAFIFEAGGIGFLGAIVGIILGVVLNIFLVEIGIDYGAFFRDIDIGYRIQNIMRGAWSIKSLIIAFVSGITLSMVVSLLPIRRALKMDIPACLTYQ
ncbi:MAG: FtsX-like permease family protein [Bacteroidia bacterium]|nr:FtsX-like permease family protein [Bacteroidia bacterium]